MSVVGTNRFLRNNLEALDYSIVEAIEVLDRLKDIHKPPHLHPTMTDNLPARPALTTLDCSLASLAELVIRLEFREECFEF